MVSTRITEIENLVNQVLSDKGFELVDIELKREPVGMVLRVYIDSDGGVNIDDCAKISESISRELDKEDLISQSCVLEVSSPGIERPLRKPEHFEKYVGSKIYVKTREPIRGRRQFKGIIDSAKDEMFLINCDRDIYEISYDKLANAHLVVEVNL